MPVMPGGGAVRQDVVGMNAFTDERLVIDFQLLQSPSHLAKRPPDTSLFLKRLERARSLSFQRM